MSLREELKKAVIKKLQELNPYHDRLGKFATAQGGGLLPSKALVRHKVATKTKQKMAGGKGKVTKKDASSVTLYHGTSKKEVIDNIRKNGLRPAKAGERLWDSDLYTGGRGKSIYFEKDKMDALVYGLSGYTNKLEASIPWSSNKYSKIKRVVESTMYAVVEVSLPKSVVKKDEKTNSHGTQSFRVEGKVHPEYIKAIHVYTYKDLKKKKRIKGPYMEQGNDIYYAFVAFLPKRG